MSNQGEFRSSLASLPLIDDVSREQLADQIVCLMGSDKPKRPFWGPKNYFWALDIHFLAATSRVEVLVPR